MVLRGSRWLVTWAAMRGEEECSAVQCSVAELHSHACLCYSDHTRVASLARGQGHAADETPNGRQSSSHHPGHAGKRMRKKLANAGATSSLAGTVGDASRTRRRQSTTSRRRRPTRQRSRTWPCRRGSRREAPLRASSSSPSLSWPTASATGGGYPRTPSRRNRYVFGPLGSLAPAMLCSFCVAPRQAKEEASRVDDLGRRAGKQQAFSSPPPPFHM